jgi:hypothetical protein
MHSASRSQHDIDTAQALSGTAVKEIMNQVAQSEVTPVSSTNHWIKARTEREPSMKFRPKMMSNCILKQFRIGLYSERLHHFVFMEGHGARFQIQRVGDFFHGHAFSKQLEDFALPRRNSFFLRVRSSAS